LDRFSRLLLIPTAIGTLAGLGLGQMTNVLQPYWPEAPHWVFAVLFWSGAALTVVPLPTWLMWLGWKNRKTVSRRWKMIFGFALLLGGCAMGVVGLSIIAAGDSSTIAENIPAPPQPAPSSMAATHSDHSESSASPPAVIDLDDNAEASLKNIQTNGTGTFLKQRGNSKISIENGSARCRPECGWNSVWRIPG
jgi:hypothetical protein